MSSYRYNVELKYISNNKEINIETDLISSIVTDYDYENKNMPIIYLTVKLNKNLLDDMIINTDVNTMTLRITKLDVDAKNSINKDYIRDEFVYFLPSDPNYLKDIDNNDVTSKTQEIYKSVTIGLINMRLINNNKRLINDVFSANMISIIHYYTNHMKMLIEPLDYNQNYSYFIVPAMNSITRLIKYLNDYCVLYDTKYRFFMDFDKTYLISSSGKGIPCKDGSYSSVIINIKNPATPEAQIRGLNIDHKNKAYTMDVDALNTNVKLNRTTEKMFNSIIGVDSFGNVDNLKLKINNNKLSNDRPRIERIHNENLNKIKNLKNATESTAAILNITKPEIDSSIFTINKEYNINNFAAYSKLNGKFILSHKKEVFLQEDPYYISNTVLSFRKVIS